jgi:hypothetical protein
MNGAADNLVVTPAARGWRWLPSPGVLIWLLFFVGIQLSDGKRMMISADGDPSLHWAIGDWMIRERAVIRVEQFSHTRFGAPLISKEWLSEVAMGAAGHFMGWAGIVWLAAALIATCLWMLYRWLIADGHDPLVSGALVFLAAMSCSMHWLARPHLATHLLAVVFARLLGDFGRGRVSAGRLWAALPALMIVWVNLHGAFFTGLVLVGIHLAGALLVSAGAGQADCARARGRAASLAALFGACLLATLVNPNGWRLHAHVVEFLREPGLIGRMDEFASPNFHSGGLGGFLLQLALLGWLLVWARQRLAPTEIVTLAVWGYFALHSVRNVPIFSLLATPILARGLTAWLSGQATWVGLADRAQRIEQHCDGRVWMAVALACMVALARPAAAGGGWLHTDVLDTRLPVAAVAFARTEPGRLRGEMFNLFIWGGYLVRALPERRVFADSRSDFYGADLMRDYIEVNEARPGWVQVLERHGVGWTLLSPNHPLNALLELHPLWERVYEDPVAVIFTRR